MEDHENIYDKLKELLGGVPNQFRILEEKIDIDLQLEYFEESRRNKNLIDPGIIAKSDNLFSEDTPIEEKKCLLSKVALLGNVESFRIIERFLSGNPGELKNWGILAYQESRMLLETKLLDENHILISTGLGGSGEKLRYFIVLFGKDKSGFSDFQRKIIQNEMEIGLKKYSSDLEEIKFSGSLATILAMIPMKAIIKNVFSETIIECNQYGNFLLSDFIITNVKELTFEEIREYIKSKKKKKK